MLPYVFIGKVSAKDGPFVLTTDKSRIENDKRDVYITPLELSYLLFINSETELEYYDHDLEFSRKVDVSKLINLWRMKPFDNLLSCECSRFTRDSILKKEYKLPEDTKVID